MAPNLKLCMTAGIGSDHVDLEAAAHRKATVTEVTFCNSISVSEHVCMQILALVRNFIPSYNQVREVLPDLPDLPDLSMTFFFCTNLRLRILVRLSTEAGTSPIASSALMMLRACTLAPSQLAVSALLCSGAWPPLT
jgi:lactate dehydrogenase-like 2-hydroxyacid dehydrogenase